MGEKLTSTVQKIFSVISVRRFSMIPERLKLGSNYLIAWNKLLYFCIFSDFNDSCSFE